ncbi:MAG TPA: reverse transcriptase domain-containing protein [Chlamydiales bacterium]|nr:reverse transcriptase domain-containing protein [Chlamydiales bacterium]
MASPSDTRDEDCANTPRVLVLRLGATVLLDSKSFFVSLTSDNVLDPFRALVDSGSSDCFADPRFIRNNELPVRSVDPIPLVLIDGSVNTYITEVCSIHVRFPSGDDMVLEFYVTPLESSCAVVLGLSWLLRYNPLIDWRLGRVTFRSISHQEFPTSSTNLAAAVLAPMQSDPPTSSPSELPTSEPPMVSTQTPHISIVNAIAFARACKLEGSQAFQLNFATSSELFSRAATTLDESLLTEVPEEYHEFADVFSKKKADSLAEHRPYDLRIITEEGSVPPIGPIYSLSANELQALREFIDENLAIGFIRPSRSPCGAPVLFVKKKDGSLRLCVDFRGLNKITKKDRYPIPLIADLLDAPKRARIYSKIDLKHAYHLVRIAEGDEWKTAFRTRYGSFEWLVMPFGLSNAPAVFQRFMNDIFADMLDVTVVVYLDDILIYSDDEQAHRVHVREVLRRLRANGLYASEKKCFFHKDRVEFLGYVLSPEGLRMDEAKVKVIQDWPEPRKVKDVQSFLGFANFYRRFILDYSRIVVPLTRLTRKSMPWAWTEACQLAFDELKRSFISAPILTHWVPDAPIVVETDASDYALAAIISTYVDGDIHPIAFHSRTFNSAELNYDVHDKELLAIFEAFQKWRHYLEGTPVPVDVITDHKNLEYFSTTKMLSRRQARWSEFLSQFNLVIRFRPGKRGTKPDALTRRWDVYLKEGDSSYAMVNPQNCRPVFTQDQLTSSLRATYLAPLVLRSASAMDLEQLHKDIKDALADDLIAKKHLSEPSDPRWTVSEDGFLRQDNKIYVPEANDLRLRVLQFKHDHVLAGHFGQNKTLELVRRDYTWPNLRTFVFDFVRTCTTCKRNKSQRHKPYGFLKQLPIPCQPWNSISMDFIEQLPGSNGFTDILVIIDRLTKQAIFIPTHNTINAPELSKLFVTHVFSKHGVPSHVTSDRGSEFVSRFFRSLGTALDMKLHFTSGYHPEGDGQTERTNQTLEQYLRVYCNYQQSNWADLLPLAEFAYNNAPSATTGISPFFANKGYNPNLSVQIERELLSENARDYVADLDELHTELKRTIAEAQTRYQITADRRRSAAPDIKVGDEVYVLAKFIHTTRPAKKLSEKYLGPFEVISKPGSSSYLVSLPQHMRAIHPVFHVSMLEPSIPNTIPGRTISPPPPVEIDGSLEYEVEEILDSKIDRRRRIQLQYFVQWAGYQGRPDEFSWLDASDLENSDELVAEFHMKYPDKPGPDTRFFRPPLES